MKDVPQGCGTNGLRAFLSLALSPLRRGEGRGRLLRGRDVAYAYLLESLCDPLRLQKQNVCRNQRDEPPDIEQDRDTDVEQSPTCEVPPLRPAIPEAKGDRDFEQFDEGRHPVVIHERNIEPRNPPRRRGRPAADEADRENFSRLPRRKHDLEPPDPQVRCRDLDRKQPLRED